ncbi:hypothetical protein [Mucilaginibacter sp. UR6-11]|uniref:hypothetical protein n=1 Tax=Mucilaginibacter sp. UR6-11 TaxID=1435644 RepID=UPI001E2D5B6F|nr:hypothetical protein [Mucilaginibacter sp. UR6-11]MCC8423403.1 hypothetical protein [Mucilaginibacter sp. UR6-11]
MKYLLKIILPPLFAFWAFAAFIKFTPFFHHVDGMANLGEDTVYGLIAYYKIFAPVQIIIALLTQFLIVMPLWRKILAKPRSAIVIFTIMFFVCLILAFGLGYVIWDAATPVSRLIAIGFFMTGVQLFYWIFNFLILYLLDWKAFRKTAQPSTIETDTSS